jgi:hypothetical protein
MILVGVAVLRTATGKSLGKTVDRMMARLILISCGENSINVLTACFEVRVAVAQVADRRIMAMMTRATRVLVPAWQAQSLCFSGWSAGFSLSKKVKPVSY